MAECWLARFSDKSCEGCMDKAHLIPKQRMKHSAAWIKSEVGLYDSRAWVWACRYHHEQFDRAQSDRKRLIIPREALPEGCEALAEQMGLLYWLDRRYGPVIDSYVG